MQDAGMMIADGQLHARSLCFDDPLWETLSSGVSEWDWPRITLVAPIRLSTYVLPSRRWLSFTSLVLLCVPVTRPAMSKPLGDLSPSKQNSRSMLVPESIDNKHSSPTNTLDKPTEATPAPTTQPVSIQQSSPPQHQMSSPEKQYSPVKYKLQDDVDMANSPPGSPANGTTRINDGLTRALAQMQQEALVNHERGEYATTPNSMQEGAEADMGEESYFTLDLGDKTGVDDTVGDLSSISAIPTDMTRFANLRTSPNKAQRTDSWSPSKQLRNSVLFNSSSNNQRPLHLLARSNSTNDADETPRRPRNSSESPTDLLNFTGQSSIIIPPPGSAPRTTRRSPSGRGAFPIKVSTSPTHRSQASVDRERATGRSPMKAVPATPASHRHSMHASVNSLGLDLLDLDMEPMATPRSIPTVTPRELETLRSELQSRISGLEATLSGKEAEVMALKRSVTDAEVRVGKTSEELRTERVAREEVEHSKEELERRSREMENVLREVKQNAFVEERERDKLRRQAEEAERRTEEAEVKILELNASLDALQSDRLRSPVKAEPATPGANLDIDFAVKNATESVARELHALYKGKHERKVADLKVSYEKRWIKQVDQLRAELKASQDEVAKLQTEKEATMSGVIPGHAEALSRMDGQIDELRRYNEEINAQKKVLEAESAGLNSQVETLSRETDVLRKDLQQERLEKGDLVAQIDEFLSLKAEEEEIAAERARTQAALQQPVSPPRSEDGSGHRQNASTPKASPSKSRTSTGGETGFLRTSRPRPMSMLQKPTAGKFSSIPAPGSGLKAPTSKMGGYAGRSGGIMEGIARMGAGGR